MTIIIWRSWDRWWFTEIACCGSECRWSETSWFWAKWEDERIRRKGDVFWVLCPGLASLRTSNRIATAYWEYGRRVEFGSRRAWSVVGTGAAAEWRLGWVNGRGSRREDGIWPKVSTKTFPPGTPWWSRVVSASPKAARKSSRTSSAASPPEWKHWIYTHFPKATSKVPPCNPLSTE